MLTRFENANTYNIIVNYISKDLIHSFVLVVHVIDHRGELSPQQKTISKTEQDFQTSHHPMRPQKQNRARPITHRRGELNVVMIYSGMFALKIPNHILIDMHFNEVVEKVNSTAVIRDWFTLLLQVYVRQSHVPPPTVEFYQELVGGGSFRAMVK